MAGISRFVGIPFKEKGREFDGVDCWGLVYLIYKKLKKVKLPTFVNSYTLADKNEIEHLVKSEKLNWIEVERPEIYDIVLFKIAGKESHVGIYLGRRKFIHSLENVGVVIESLDSTVWRNRLVGVYHYVETVS